MPTRTAEEIREEIAAERLGLQEDLDALRARLRSLLPYVVAGLAGVVLLAGALLIGIKKHRKHASNPRG